MQNQEKVQATNSDALSCKLSAIQQGYLIDPFSKAFMKRVERKPPLINRGTYTRVTGIDQRVEKFVKDYKDGNIISLGAGSDSRYFILKSKGHSVGLYVEIDYSAITMQKAMAICKNREMKSMLKDLKIEKGGQDLVSLDYWLISGDLTHFKEMIERLISRGLDTTKPTLFISECVLIYLPPLIGDQIISIASSQFPNSFFITYEQINPDDPFGKTMISNLALRGLCLESISAYPSLESQKQRYIKSGFRNVVVMDLLQYWNSISEDERKRVSKLEIFDEIEEFELLMQHYCLVFATNQ